MSSLTTLVGIGPKTNMLFEFLGINDISKLIHFYPHRYLDFSNTKSIVELEIGTPATFSGEVINFQNVYTRAHKNIQRATIRDNTGSLNLIWFNQPYLSKTIVIGQTISIAGTPSIYQNKATVVAPLVGNKTGRIIPIYHQTTGLKSSQIEKVIHQNLPILLKPVNELLPKSIINKYQLLHQTEALKQIHQPSNPSQLSLAQTRINLNQSLSLLSLSHLQKQTTSKQKPAYLLTTAAQTDFLPYDLSPSQQIAWNEVKSDLLGKRPAHRLLSGDVGSGKTIVAILAAHLTSTNNQLTLLVAPTQILAKQHYTSFSTLLKKCPVLLLDNKSKLKSVPSNAIIISTHAAFYQQENLLKKVALLIIDEQHKFGVSQRNFLNKYKNPPHSLSLTATPIPRTLALSIYGHLDVSTLSHLPRWQPVKTFVVSPPKVEDCYRWLDTHIKKTKEQAFIVCPFIEDSEVLTEVKSATTEFKNLQSVFPKLRLELIHSKIKPVDRKKIFDSFQNGTIDILITTPIIEVGIDFPNATVIIIQSADRFGLASLHQLRGRVGRGNSKGYCYLFGNSSNPRLNYLTNHFEGQQLAEFDLKSRGQGMLFSTLQHGHFYLDASSINLASKIINDLIVQEFDLNNLIEVNSQDSSLRD
ncbi:DEAD/DEAH box helicase [Candidatus Shapirobacteria bacterium]|nr:DEAD/DEAH box helicase [Candidatus Shapirobacteria bacterium]